MEPPINPLIPGNGVNHHPQAEKGFTRNLLIALGSLCVGLGLLGMFLPVLPTTPFLLLAAYLYARSSERFLHWLLTNRWFGEYIRNYRLGLGIPLRQKLLSLTLLWLTIGFSAGFVLTQWWARLLLVGIAAGVTVHLARVKTYRPPGKAVPLEEAPLEVE